MNVLFVIEPFVYIEFKWKFLLILIILEIRVSVFLIAEIFSFQLDRIEWAIIVVFLFSSND